MITPDARIWERSRRHPDFLAVRVGLTDRQAIVTLRRGTASINPPTLYSVPLTWDLRAGPLGVCGPRPVGLGVTRWILAQVATHSPSDVAVAAIIADSVTGSWAWLSWLPHLGTPDGRAGGTAISEVARRALIDRVAAIVDDGRTAARLHTPGTVRGWCSWSTCPPTVPSRPGWDASCRTVHR